jgi:NAD(P)-dependent dehydrogenase (short-subunit alcohol dehydrogenase family)
MTEVAGARSANGIMQGAVAVVTGGARGIGAALSRHLAEAGARVVVADLLLDEGKRLADELEAAGGEAIFVRTDVADQAATAALAEQAVARFGRIDALINNAAIYADLGHKTSFTDISVADWDRVMAVNTRGVWLTMRAVHPVMKQQGYGRIVNIASSTVHMGVPFFAHYTASKGAVMALTRSVAREVGGDGITVNAIAPGLVHNEASTVLNGESYFEVAARNRAIPRSMVPGDLAGAIEFLCSPASGFVTGQTFVIDGGVVFS